MRLVPIFGREPSNEEQSQARADAREVIRARGHFSRAFAVFFAVTQDDNIKLRFHGEQKTESVSRCDVEDTKRLEVCNQSVTL